MSRKIQFTCLFVLLGLLSTAAQSGFAQSSVDQLNFGNNFFVTGDYVVARAQGLNTNFANDGTTTGTIKFPDGNPGITGKTSVPKGAQIVGALLYWQTVEKFGITPGGPGSGQNGFFRPVFQVPPPGGQLTPYPITGLAVNTHTSVSFSFGGCTGSSGGKTVQTYRADVRSFLPRDANGNVLVDAADGVTFEVRLPSVGPSTPLTLGATLVLIYRVLSPTVPLNSIVIYDGAFAPNNSLSTLNMTQTLKGFYDAATTPSLSVPNPVSRLTHIVGGGKNYKYQTVSLNGKPLPPLYATGQPFPGYYGGLTGYGWDNTTWTFDPNKTYVNVPNPVGEDNASATTMVVPTGSNQGCVSWGAVIFSTTVHDDDKDGILKVWKQNQQYTDVGTGQVVSLADPDPNNLAKSGQQDVFIQLDHVVDSTGDFTPKLGVESMVHDAFLAHNIHLHITDKNAIQEPKCIDNLNPSPPQLCAYPNQPGITTWPDGFEFLKNQLLDSSGNVCTSPPAPSCVTRFPIAQRNSHHYVVFGDALGAVNWGLLGGTLMDTTGTKIGGGGGVVMQSGSTGSNAGNMVTFNTSTAHGLKVDHIAGNGRVTITGAISNPNPNLHGTSYLNGTYWVTSVTCQDNPETGVKNDCSVSNKAPGPYTFTITIGGNPIHFNYTRFTDPNLAVASGLAGTGSGFSYVGGSGTLVTLGRWGNRNNVRSQSGTFMHELGHTLGLQHGGGDSINCKSNYQSVMNYMFQTALLGPNGGLDFSSQQLSDLDETKLGPITTTDPQIAFSTTSWYDTKQTFVTAAITSFAIASNVVTFQAVNSFTPGDMVTITGLTVGAYLNGQVLTVTSASGTQFQANFKHADVSSTNDSGTAVKALGSTATHHCDGTPLSIADPTTYFYQGGTQPFPISPELDIPWPLSGQGDVDFDGKKPITGSEIPFHGYNDWANTDLRQVGASGSVLLGPGGLFTGPGGLFTGPGGLFTGPGGLFTGPGAFFTGPGGLFTGPGGLFTGPGGLFTGPGASGGEIDLATAISVVHAPGALAATEDPSPRIIHLSWTAPTLFDSFNVYRSSDNGTTFSFLKNVSGSPTTDNVTCNPAGYKYFVTTVFTNTAQITSFSITSGVVTFQATNSFSAGDKVQITGLSVGTYLNGQVLTVGAVSNTQFSASFTHADVSSTPDSGMAANTKESTPSNTAPSSGPKLTGCYTNTPGSALPVLNDLSFPPNPNVHGSLIPITWTLQVDNPASYVNPPVTFVNNLLANTLDAIGPLQPSAGGACPTSAPAGPVIHLLSNGIVNQAYNTSTYGVSSGQFTYTLDTDVLSSGCYFLKLTTDSGQSETTTSALQLQIDVNDSDSTPHITTPTTLTAGTVDSLYTQYQLAQHGGVGTITWSFSGNLPPANMSETSAGLISGIPCTAGNFNFMVTATDSNLNSGTLGLKLQINKANTATSVTSDANPAVYGQIISFTVTVAPNSPCIPTGTVTLYSDLNQITSKLLNGVGTATFTTSLPVGTHNITATYGGDGNFIGSTTSAPLVQVVNKASTTTGVTSNFNPSVFGQPVTFTATVSPVAPGAGVPTGMVNFYDGGTSIGSSALVSGGVASQVASLTTSALGVATHNITATYGGDGNFLVSTSASYPQTVNQASTTTTISSVLPSPAFVGQAITVAYTLAVTPPGGTPIAPTGTVTVAASDGSGCIVPAALGPGVCMLSPAAATAGLTTFTVTYSGDSNFVLSGANGNYTVYIYVSDTVPPPFTPATTLPDATVNFPYNNTVYESGGISDGVTPFTWTIVPSSLTLNGSPAPDGSLGISFQPNTVAGGNNGTLSGTPTTAGTYAFNAMVTDSAGNTGSQTLTLPVQPCAAFPAGVVPVTTVFSIATDSAGDKFVVGGRSAGGLQAALQQVPLPNVVNQRFCSPVTLETNYTVPAYVPTAAERSGDFSSYAGLTLIDPTTQQPFAGNIIPPDRLDTIFAWRIPPHSANLTPLSCSLEPTLHSIEGNVKTSIQFVNNTASPVNIYWINYQGQRVFYRGGPFATLAAGQSYAQGTYITHPWIVTDVANNSCLGIWEPTESAGTAVITGSPSFVAPPAPTTLTAAEQGTPPAAESVTLNWGGSNNVSYNIYRATAAAGPFTQIGSVGPPPVANLTFTDTNVNSGTTYYYVVTAVDNNVESADSNEVTVLVP